MGDVPVKVELEEQSRCCRDGHHTSVFARRLGQNHDPVPAMRCSEVRSGAADAHRGAANTGCPHASPVAHTICK